MLTFTDIMRFPGQFAKRESLISNISIEIAHVQESPDKLSLGGISSTNYAQKIEIDKINGKFELRSPIKVQCSCQSFQYEFAGPLLRVDGLIEKEYYEYSIRMNKPKKKNPNQVLGVCKHLVKFSRLVWSRKDIKNHGLIQNIMTQRKYMMASQQVSMSQANPRDPYQQMDRQDLLRKQREQKRVAALIK